MLQVLGTGRAYQQEQLRAKEKCTSRRKSAKEGPYVTCCGNASRNHKLKFSVLVKPKSHNYSRVLEQTVFLSITATKKEHGWMRRLFKIASASTFFQKLQALFSRSLSVVYLMMLF
jgi:hypothetical protein